MTISEKAARDAAAAHGGGGPSPESSLPADTVETVVEVNNSPSADASDEAVTPTPFVEV